MNPQTVPTIIRLADARRATSGLCSCCDRPAIGWSRSGRRDTDLDGMPLAVRYCEDHEKDAEAAMSALTAQDVAALIPRNRARRAATARAKADRLRGYSTIAYRTSARLRGASSLTHTHGLWAAYSEMQASAYDALAYALDSSR